MKKEMTGLQKIIKYCAIALAVSIILSVFFGVLKAFRITDFVLDWTSTEKGELSDLDTASDFDILKINVISTDLIIKNGEKFSVETDNEYIESELKSGKFIISEKKHNVLEASQKTTLTIIVPKDYQYKRIDIDTGAGEFKAEKLTGEYVDLSVGAGKVNIGCLVASKDAEIDGGAGEIIISDGSINRFDFTMGVGKATIMCKLMGKNEISCGIGALDLTLKGNKSDYKVKINKGIGDAEYCKEIVNDEKVFGDGQNIVTVDGGIGKINVDFLKK